MRSSALPIIFLVFFFSACNSVTKKEQTKIQEVAHIDGTDQIMISLKAGNLTIQSIEAPVLNIDGAMVRPDSMRILNDGSKTQVLLGDSGPSDTFQVGIPDSIELKINTFSANVSIKNYTGSLEVRSTSGDVLIQHFSGSALIWAGRGDVTVSDSTGDVVLIGEHGELSVSNSIGDLSISTIMGTIEYTAPVALNHSVSLESDHGSVNAKLPERINTHVAVSSTSGMVACLGKEFLMTNNGCTGILGEGGGEILVRTVSGNVNLAVVQDQVED